MNRLTIPVMVHWEVDVSDPFFVLFVQLQMNTQEKHQPAKGKYNPICPAFPLLKDKERQGY